MHTAAKDGNEYTMTGLVKLGADINIKDNDGVTETTGSSSIISLPYNIMYTY